MTREAEEWSYSVSAINVLDRFHESKFVVLVEGEDDVSFWASLFDKSHIEGYYIDYVGGIKELEKVMEQIIHDDARVIVACDAHYSLLLNNLPHHVRIVSSFGHSIENTIYCPHVINRVIRKFSHDTEDRTTYIVSWYNTFCDIAKILVVYDLAREKYSKPVKVSGDNCARFLKSSRSYTLDDLKIQSFIHDIADHFNTYEIKTCEKLIDDSIFQIRYIINGHFMTTAVINLIKAAAKRVTKKRPVIPVDNLYALVSDGCIPCAHDCPEFSSYRERLNRAVESLMLIS